MKESAVFTQAVESQLDSALTTEHGAVGNSKYLYSYAHNRPNCYGLCFCLLFLSSHSPLSAAGAVERNLSRHTCWRFAGYSASGTGNLHVLPDGTNVNAWPKL